MNSESERSLGLWLTLVSLPTVSSRFRKITVWGPSQDLESSGPARLPAKKADDIKVDQK